MQTNKENKREERINKLTNKSNGGAFFVGLSYQSENVSPDIRDGIGGKWYEWGRDNRYPQFLATLTKKSTTHGNMVDFLTKAIAGEGVLMLNPDGSENLEAQAIWDKWNEREISSTLLERLVKDLVLYEGISPAIKWSNGVKADASEAEETGINLSPDNGNIPTDATISVYYSSFKNYRAGIPSNPTGNIDCYYFSPEWGKGVFNQDPIKVGQFDINTAHLSEDQVMYLFFPNDLSDAYPSPSYTSAVDAILTEGALMNYHKNNVNNAFQPSGILEIEQFAETEERNQFKKDLADSYQGTENAGGVMVVERNGQDGSKVNFIAINQTDATDRYISLANELAQRIASSHGAVSTSIVGQLGSTGFSSNAEELAMSFALMELKKIQPYQRFIERAITKLFEYVPVGARGAVAQIQSIDFLQLLNLTTEEPNGDNNI